MTRDLTLMVSNIAFSSHRKLEVGFLCFAAVVIAAIVVDAVVVTVVVEVVVVVVVAVVLRRHETEINFVLLLFLNSLLSFQSMIAHIEINLFLLQKLFAQNEKMGWSVVVVAVVVVVVVVVVVINALDATR